MIVLPQLSTLVVVERRYGVALIGPGNWPDEVAVAILYNASEEASFVSGHSSRA